MFEFILYSILYKIFLLSINCVIVCSLKSELYLKGVMINIVMQCIYLVGVFLQCNLFDLCSEFLKFLQFFVSFM